MVSFYIGAFTTQLQTIIKEHFELLSSYSYTQSFSL